MRLDRLPRGITGFFERSETPRVVDPSVFKRACYSVAHVLGGSVEIADSTSICRSYYLARIRTKAEYFSVLANSTYPYLSFASHHFDWSSLCVDFAESVELASVFAAMTPFETLDADWLKSEIKADQLSDLSPAEIKELKYWGPQTVGEVIFNFWD